MWYCYYNGGWRRTTGIGVLWVVVETHLVPKVILNLPPGWRKKVVIKPSAVPKKTYQLKPCGKKK
ncbi:MAG: hypothetical protein N2Z73_01940, partial [Endomicrobia bacterium]|nr:hypothetical protein [Endomicrobiia bacterium]